MMRGALIIMTEILYRVVKKWLHFQLGAVLILVTTLLKKQILQCPILTLNQILTLDQMPYQMYSICIHMTLLNVFHMHPYDIIKCIPYLDLMIRRQINGQLRFLVYRKDMHTDQYLNVSSYNSVTHKTATASTLFHRAESHCSEEFKEAEFNTVKPSLTLNGYSNTLINTCR